jgi:undecaprenyl-diphosphatase
VTLLQAVVLGIVQGVGEFLPISSSAHLILTPWFFGWEEHGLAIDVALHIGTFLAVLIFYREIWWKMAKDVFSLRGDKRLFFLLVIGTIPGAIMGYLGEHWAETVFRQPLIIAFTLSFLGLLLYYVDRRSSNNQRIIESIRWQDAVLVGIAQGCAIIPGFSRSGTTITAALLLGMRREAAARFSFYLSVPITLGAIVKKLPEIVSHPEVSTLPFWAAIATAAVVGWIAISFLIKYVSQRSYAPFTLYRLGLAAIILFVYFKR